MIHVHGGKEMKYNKKEEIDEAIESEVVPEEDLEEAFDSIRPEEPVTSTLTPITALNLRSTPNKDDDNVIGVLKPGDKLTVSTDADKEWVNVTTESGVTGYVMSKFIKTLE
jgi:uncharacterized protein YgiM (DUF1202 family)